MKRSKVFFRAFCTIIIFYIFIKLTFDLMVKNFGIGWGPFNIILISVSCFAGLFLSMFSEHFFKKNPEVTGYYIPKFVLMYAILFGIGLLPISHKCVLLPQLVSLLYMIPGVILFLGYLMKIEGIRKKKQTDVYQ